MSLDDSYVFLLRPLVLADIWIQVVVPSLSALLSYSSRQLLCNEAPVLGSVLKN
jgi:hypothetical protein